ncbi:hypothetical protein OM427_24950 [Halomonas sp. 18H]|nr:hypothetical protein [Halomonas sp. 18H]MCW4152767.1 hypothetical protein [Halomonas sp. 18H]
MNFLITPPSSHFDGGIGITACNFKNAAETLKEHGSSLDDVLPLCYLYRHAVELFLKSVTFILHKKYAIEFGVEFSLDRPGIKVRDRWVAMENTHNLSDLYVYFEALFDQCKALLPSTTRWDLPGDIKQKINLVSGTDPKSTFFRYPKSGSEQQDKKKTKIQKTDLDKAFANPDKPAKLVVMLDENDNLIESYDLDADTLGKVESALSDLCDFFYGMHAAFRCELTNGS